MWQEGTVYGLYLAILDDACHLAHFAVGLSWFPARDFCLMLPGYCLCGNATAKMSRRTALSFRQPQRLPEKAVYIFPYYRPLPQRSAHNGAVGRVSRNYSDWIVKELKFNGYNLSYLKYYCKIYFKYS